VERIAEAAREAGTASGTIAGAITQQAGMIRMLSQRSAELEHTGEENAAAAEEISVAMNELSEMAHRTENEMSRLILS
jgi:methyl-accepting chemotaxis protein